TRRPEPYHQLIRDLSKRHPKPKGADEETEALHEAVRVKETGLEQRIHYDWYRLATLLDHFVDPAGSHEEFANATYRELRDFVNLGYGAKVEQTGEIGRAHV